MSVHPSSPPLTGKKYVSVILILGALTALGPFSIDMYLPGFPEIARDLDTTDARVALSLTGFFIGISAGQLLYGPLLDRFGRKKPLYIGLLVYLLASVGCIFVRDINSLIALRCVQALGSCAATVASVAMVRDLFPVKDSAKVFALLVLILGASPMLAPTIGGYITTAFGWHYVFLALTLIGAGTLAACLLWLPDVYIPNRQLSLKPAPMLRNFYSVLTEPQFYTYALTGAFAFAGLFAYVSGSPLVFMKVFGLSGKVYGWIFAFLSVGFVGCSQINTVLLRRIAGAQIVRVALIIYSVFAVIFLATAIYGVQNLPLTIVLLFLCLGCVGIINPNTSALALAPFPQNAGSASALMGALQMGLGAIISAAISLFDRPSLLPLSGVMAGAALAALLINSIGRRFIVHRVEASADAEAMALH